MAPQQARRILSRWGDETQRVLGSRRQTCPNLRYLYLTRCWLARGKRSPTAPWGRQGVRPPAPSHTVLQPRLHPNSPRRPHLRTRRACAPLPVAFAPTRPTPEPACPPQPRLTPRATPRVGALKGAFDLAAKGRERRAEGRSGDGVARAGLASAQGPVGKPRGHAGATFRATPVPGAPTPTGCPTLTNVFFKLCWVFFRVQYYLVVSCGPKEPRGGL